MTWPGNAANVAGPKKGVVMTLKHCGRIVKKTPEGTPVAPSLPGIHGNPALSGYKIYTPTPFLNECNALVRRFGIPYAPDEYCRWQAAVSRTDTVGAYNAIEFLLARGLLDLRVHDGAVYLCNGNPDGLPCACGDGYAFYYLLPAPTNSTAVS